MVAAHEAACGGASVGRPNAEVGVCTYGERMGGAVSSPSPFPLTPCLTPPHPNSVGPVLPFPPVDAPATGRVAVAGEHDRETEGEAETPATLFSDPVGARTVDGDLVMVQNRTLSLLLSSGYCFLLRGLASYVCLATTALHGNTDNPLLTSGVLAAARYAEKVRLLSEVFSPSAVERIAKKAAEDRDDQRQREQSDRCVF